MADEWIKMRRNLAGDPAVIAVARTLGVKPFEVVGMLHSFWSWADEHTVDGEIPAADARFVDDLVRRRGFAGALQAQEWLTVHKDGITIPHFTRHNGKSAKVRAGEALAKRQRREKAKRDVEDGNCPGNVREMSGHSTDTDRTHKRRSRNREEKEEVKNIVGQEPDASPPEVEKPKVNGHDKTRELRREAIAVLDFLNTKAGRKYEAVPANVDLIVARLREGFTPAQCRQVVAKKFREWGTDDKMDEFLRPKTLFNRTNFANYSGELVEVPDDGV